MAPTAADASQPAATTGPRPGIAKRPRPASRPPTPPTAAPMPAPLPASSPASEATASALCVPRLLFATMLTSRWGTPAASRSCTARRASSYWSNRPVRVCVMSLSYRWVGLDVSRFSARRPANHEMVENQHHDGTDDGDEQAVEVKTGNSGRPELIEQEAADDGADDTEHDVEEDTLPGPVDDLAADEPGDQAEDDPGDDGHDILPRISGLL